MAFESNNLSTSWTEFPGSLYPHHLHLLPLRGTEPIHPLTKRLHSPELPQLPKPTPVPVLSDTGKRVGSIYRYGLGALVSVVRSEDATASAAGPSSSNSNPTPIPPPIQAYPLSIDLADLSVFSRSTSQSSSHANEGLSSPGTPVLSASGSFADSAETEDDGDGDGDTDSLFGDGDTVSIAEPEVELESRVGKMQHVGAVARSPLVLAPAYLSSATGAGTDFVIPNSTSYFGPSASASFDPTPTFEFDSLLPSLDEFNFDLGMDSFPNLEVKVGGLG